LNCDFSEICDKKFRCSLRNLSPWLSLNIRLGVSRNFILQALSKKWIICGLESSPPKIQLQNQSTTAGKYALQSANLRLDSVEAILGLTKLSNKTKSGDGWGMMLRVPNNGFWDPARSFPM
jgi:hypothetical protein